MKAKEYMNEVYLAFKKRDAKKLRTLDEMMLRDASLAYSKILYHMAVVSYVLSKILSKPRFLERKYNEHINALEKNLEELSISKEGTDEEFRARFEKLENTIKNLEADDPRFVTDLISKGKLKVAATLYAQGISLGMAAEITGIQKHEILFYAGHTMMFDRVKEEKKVLNRLKSLMDITEG